MYVKVHVYPEMKSERVTKLSEHSYEFVLKESAERNLANKRTQLIIAELYGLEVRQVRQVTGHRSQSKIFEVLET
jgi:uncharacterized protein YggU (UPF0235/DUF167 family)